MKKKKQEENKTIKKKSKAIPEKNEKQGWKWMKKILLILIKILRWPAMYYGALLVGWYGYFGIIGGIQGGGSIVNLNIWLLAGILILLVLAAGIITSALFTETFLASTGLAAGMYLVASLFFSSNLNYQNDDIEYDVMKMLVILVLVGTVLLGDIIVFVFRKMLKNRSMRHMVKRT